MEMLYDLSKTYRPAPNTSIARRETDWAVMSNDALKFALDLLSLHYSPYEVDAMNEVMRRVEAGTWLDINAAPPANEQLPAWLKMFPFCLLWSQRPR